MNSIFNNHTKPDLSNYSLNELVETIKNYIYSNNFLTNLVEQSVKDDILDNILNNDNLTNDYLIKQIHKLWLNHSLNVECSICFNQITNNDNLTTKCGHIFHSSCIFDNVATKINSKQNNIFDCPICRNKLSNIQINLTNLSNSPNSLNSPNMFNVNNRNNFNNFNSYNTNSNYDYEGYVATSFFLNHQSYTLNSFYNSQNSIYSDEYTNNIININDLESDESDDT